MFKRKQKKDFPPRRASDRTGGGVCPQSDFFDIVKERSVRKKKWIKRILLFLVIAFLTYRFFAGPYGFIQIHSLWQEKKSLEKKSKMLQAEIVDLEIEKKRLAEDEFYLEKQARERLGMIKPGEQMFKVIHPEKPTIKEQNKSTQTSPSDSLSR